jgi:hypothetical protein
MVIDHSSDFFFHITISGVAFGPIILDGCLLPRLTIREHLPLNSYMPLLYR